MSLLEKTRQINKLLQRSAGHPVDFQDMARALSDLIVANVYVLDREGAILGRALLHGFECGVLREEVLEHRRFPRDYAQGLLRTAETLPNQGQQRGECVFKPAEQCLFTEKLSTIVPINGGGDRLGTLILARFSKVFTDEDLILSEYAATVVGMEMMRGKVERVEDEARKQAAVHVALGTLSYSELEAVRHIFAELEGDEGLLVASKIADRVGITRSVIVNALRKFESAGVIESRSLGMKGTHIKVLNDRLLAELRRRR
ncbi:MAG: GTP-sensing pleiotropic transcriptional regulator CodY [Bacillota bacterium]